MRSSDYTRRAKAALARVVLPLAAAAGLVACSHHLDLTRPATQADVGVEMAKMDLWREAMFRFQRAVEINPKDAMARNNLAVAYEANGDFELAGKEYREAMKLDRSNSYIQKNYSRYTEFMARTKKKPRSDTGAQAATAAPQAPEATPAPPQTKTPPAPPAATVPPPESAAAGAAQPPASGTAPKPASTPAPPATPPPPPPPATTTNPSGGTR